MRKNTRKNCSGFTLLEILIATILVGIAVAALLITNGAFTQVNAAGIELSTAEFLLEEIRELTVSLAVVDPETGTDTFGAESGETLGSYDDLDDLDGITFSPPIDINRSQLSNFSVFSQVITVENVSTSDLTVTVGDHLSPFVKVTVVIVMNGRAISSSSWIRTR